MVLDVCYHLSLCAHSTQLFFFIERGYMCKKMKFKLDKIESVPVKFVIVHFIR